ncbi:hypothetical protein JCM10213_005282 [Rhodosporidiobolus nylandii]
MCRPRLPLRSRLARAYSTLSAPAQRDLFRRVAQPVAVLAAHIPSPPTSPPSSTTTTAAGASEEAHDETTQQHNHGATLSSLTSISLSPPLVSFSLRLPSRLAAHLSPPEPTSSPLFRIHLLSSAQEPLARAFARQAALPAPPAPSPLPPPGGPNPWEQPLEAALFRELEEKGLGWMDCRVVQRVPLAGLGKGEGEKLEGQPQSELFIAQVETVELGKGYDTAGEQEKGCLAWREQRYLGVGGEEGEGR